MNEVNERNATALADALVEVRARLSRLEEDKVQRERAIGTLRAEVEQLRKTLIMATVGVAGSGPTSGL